MWELKEMFDPEYILNPGVVLNRDPDLHIKSLKPSPAASNLINRCGYKLPVSVCVGGGGACVCVCVRVWVCM